MSNVYIYKRETVESEIARANTDRPQTINNQENRAKRKKKKIIIITIASLVLIIILIIVLLIAFKPWENKEKDKDKDKDSTPIKIIYQNKLNYEDYKKELLFTTKVNDLRRILINQKSDEEMIINGKQTKMKLFRKTYYDFYVMSSTDDEGEYYNKTYTCSIAMVSQCLSTENDDCDLKELVDLSSIKKSSNVRNLKELNDLKDIPIALCLFNLTNTNIITSISCPESLSENIKNEILSDINYFRPIPKASVDKIDEMNITIGNNIKTITKKSNGLCEVQIKKNSLCDLDINITKNSEGYLLSIDENSFINITNDEKNGFNKKIVTKLIDETSKIDYLNQNNYKSTLQDLLLKLNPYLEYKENNNNRLLTENDNIYYNYFVKDDSLFYKEILGATINLYLKIDSGLNVEAMKSLLNLNINNKDNELINIMQFSNLNKIIKKLILLSNAGNNLAYELYENIKNNLDNLTQEITIKISNLNSLIIYKDLTEIFDSSLFLNNLKILPVDIIEESNNLFNKLKEILNRIGDENNEFSNYTNTLENDINNYFEVKYNLMNNTFKELQDLKTLLKSPKNLYTKIYTYYLNNTPTCYINAIKKVKDILNNYAQQNDESNILESSLKDFENNYYDTVEKSTKIINNLNSKLKNNSFTIENAKDEDYKKIINNIDNSNNYTNAILNKIKEEIRNIFVKQKDKYKLSDNEINIYNKTVNESIDIGDKLDKDQIIDKKYDKIMNDFKDNVTNIIIYMDKIKEQKMPLVDDILEESLFTSSIKRHMKTNISNCGVEIIKNVKRENDYYMNLIKESINQFIQENLENLNSLILDLNILLSEESLKELSNFFEYEFYNSLNSVINTIDDIDVLVQRYYNAYNTSLETALLSIKDSSEFTVTSYEKKINQTYFEKHNILKSNINKLRNYINNDLQNDFLEAYKDIIVRTKEVLLLIKNNKISEIYPGIRQFDFYIKHTNNLNELNNKIDKYFSLELFNTIYVPVLNDFKANVTEKYLENITEFIDSHHNILSKLGILQPYPDKSYINNNYFCIEMKCTGKYNEYFFCSRYDYDKYIYDTNYSIFVKNNLASREKFENVSGTINEKVNSYNSMIDKIKTNLLLLENEIINKNMTKGYLTPIQNQIHLILEERYGAKIIHNSYNYYKNNIEKKMKNILDDIENKWDKTFISLEDEIKSNLPEFKYSIEEFDIIGLKFKNTYTYNISRKFYDSIINLQKYEFNNSISYYYNYLIQLINSTYLYIINNIPTNEMMLNTIIDLRTNEITNEFNKIINNIITSKNEALNTNNQVNILQVINSDFFNSSSILNENINSVSTLLSNISYQISKIGNNKVNDQYSITSKLYLENSELGKQINLFYEEIKDNIFIYLNSEKFKEMIKNNWIIDQNDIINRLNTTLFNSNKEIYKDFLVVKENYTSILEKEINKYYTKENIITKINELYKNGTNEFNSNMTKDFKTNLYGILDRIYEHFYNESKRINSTATSYTYDFTKINNTIKNYRENIFNEVKNIYYKIIGDFRDNAFNSFYKEYIEKGLDRYIIESKKYTINFKEYKLLNSSYNLKEIIDNIIEELVNEYKEIVKRQIDYKYQMKLRNTFKLDELKEFLDYEMEMEYSILLLPILQKKAIYNPGDTGYSQYDFNDNIKNDINSLFNTNINNIKNIFSLIKGNKYQINLTETIKEKFCKSMNGINLCFNEIIDVFPILNFSNINLKLLEIENYFEKFISSENAYEKDYLNENIQNIIISNFNKSLDNIISSFGNDFFERYLKYNEYFKIKDLYDNLEFLLSQTIEYYTSKNNELSKINNELPKELKNKLINLNDIDSLIIKNKNYILELIKTKISNFIFDSKDSLINNYIDFMKDDAFIDMSFEITIKNILNENLNKVKTNIEDEYVNILNNYLNDKFLDSYNTTINEETEKIINSINNYRNTLLLEMDDLFVLESENILEEINAQIGKTIEAINQYNLNFFTFPEEMQAYLNNYGNNNIKPIYDEFKKKLDEISNNQIIANFEQNSNNYENSINLEDFIKNYNITFYDLKENNVGNITNYINNYYTNYLKNFEKEINKENYEINDNSLETTFQKLLTNIDNTKLFIQTLKEFNEYDKIISKYINNLNIAYKESKKIIDDNNDEENNKKFNDKLIYLKEKSLDYYNKIFESYYNLRQYLNQTIHEIEKKINRCVNLTYYTLIDEYKNISKEEKPFNKEFSKKDESKLIKTTNFKIEDKEYYIRVEMKNFEYYSKFNMELLFENNDFKRPKVVASIINKNKPKNMIVDVYTLYGNCAQKGIKMDANFNDVNYKMNLTYDIKSSYINATTTTNFEKYTYNSEVYEYEDSDEIECFTIAYIQFCINLQKCENKISLSNEELSNEKKESKETYFIKY